MCMSLFQSVITGPRNQYPPATTGGRLKPMDCLSCYLSTPVYIRLIMPLVMFCFPISP